MNPKGTKTLGAALDKEYHKMLSGIVTKTGEGKGELIKRLLKSEYDRISNMEPQKQSIDNSLNELKEKLNEATVALDTISKDVYSIREAENKTYCSLLNLIKDQFRLNSFVVNCFAQSSLLQPKQLSIIKEDSDKSALDSFKLFHKMITSASPIEIVKNLQK